MDRPKILIVDDELVSRTKLAAILQRTADCLAVESGAQAVAAYQEALEAGRPFDLITLDIDMPEMDGTQTLFEIREMEEKRRPAGEGRAKVIMVTALSDRDSLITCVQAGCDDYIVKPIDPDIVTARVQRYLEPSAPTPARPEPETPALKTSADAAYDIGREVMARFKRGEINLPSPPNLYMKFKALCDQGAGMDQIADLIKDDVGLSFHLISVSNSPFYRGVTENKTVLQAVGRLGLEQTRKYVNVLCNRSLFASPHQDYRPFMNDVWLHSLASANAAQIAADRIGVPLAADPFTLGLLHDVGKMVLVQVLGELEIKGKIGEGQDRRELLDSLAPYHGRLGAAILTEWKFPRPVADAGRDHDQVDRIERPSRELLVVELANALAKAAGYGPAVDREALPALRSARIFKLDAAAIDELIEQVAGEMEKTNQALKT